MNRVTVKHFILFALAIESSPFVHLECGSRNNEEKALLVALEYLTTCANLIPEAVRLVKHALDQEIRRCDRCPNGPGDCGCCAHNDVVADMKNFLAKLEGETGNEKQMKSRYEEITRDLGIEGFAMFLRDSAKEKMRILRI